MDKNKADITAIRNLDIPTLSKLAANVKADQAKAKLHILPAFPCGNVFTTNEGERGRLLSYIKSV